MSGWRVSTVDAPRVPVTAAALAWKPTRGVDVRDVRDPQQIGAAIAAARKRSPRARASTLADRVMK